MSLPSFRSLFPRCQLFNAGLDLGDLALDLMFFEHKTSRDRADLSNRREDAPLCHVLRILRNVNAKHGKVNATDANNLGVDLLGILGTPVALADAEANRGECVLVLVEDFIDLVEVVSVFPRAEILHIPQVGSICLEQVILDPFATILDGIEQGGFIGVKHRLLHNCVPPIHG